MSGPGFCLSLGLGRKKRQEANANDGLCHDKDAERPALSRYYGDLGENTLTEPFKKRSPCKDPMSSDAHRDFRQVQVFARNRMAQCLSAHVDAQCLFTTVLPLYVSNYHHVLGHSCMMLRHRVLLHISVACFEHCFPLATESAFQGKSF